MKTFLFQGDSITDAGRCRENDETYGLGYPTLFAADYLKNAPEQYKFVNRAVSGNRVVDMYARIKQDVINVKPAYISILIGVNDVWHELSYRNGISAAKFDMIYSMFIEEIREALPDVKIFILEPFVLNGTATQEKWGYFRPEVEKRAEVARLVAEKYHLVFVPLQEKFDKAAENTKTSYWLQDGVHPTPAGHQIIKEALQEAFEANK